MLSIVLLLIVVAFCHCCFVIVAYCYCCLFIAVYFFVVDCVAVYSYFYCRLTQLLFIVTIL
jgi:hypothetical protein